eukprot:c19385_g1_i3.p1 GENE.c19385_g1_i3~~c19385_g1_i3.p1  ORF type:complete len:249 (-),score=111.67 c19385_g1_i3:69-815(-)
MMKNLLFITIILVFDVSLIFGTSTTSTTPLVSQSLTPMGAQFLPFSAQMTPGSMSPTGMPLTNPDVSMGMGMGMNPTGGVPMMEPGINPGMKLSAPVISSLVLSAYPNQGPHGNGVFFRPYTMNPQPAKHTKINSKYSQLIDQAIPVQSSPKELMNPMAPYITQQQQMDPNTYIRSLTQQTMALGGGFPLAQMFGYHPNMMVGSLNGGLMDQMMQSPSSVFQYLHSPRITQFADMMPPMPWPYSGGVS